MVRKHRFRRLGAVAVVLVGAVVLAGCGNRTGPNNKQNVLRPAGPYAHKILDLTRPFFWIAVAIGIFITFGTIYVALRFREKPGEERAPKQVHGNTVLEVSWTIIPALILATMAIPTVATVFDLARRPTGPDVVHVTVSARQWWWQFTYDDVGNGIVTANELHIPVGAPVSLTLQGPPPCSGTGCYNNGVIHSFWVPELNGKKDVVPGRSQFLKLLADKPGTYLGQCAEYCGLSHANMRLRVIAQTPADYQAWVQSQLNPKPQAVLEAGVGNDKWGCASCHSFQAKTPGAIAPNLTKLADRVAFAGDIYQMTFDNLWKWVYDAPSRKPMGNLISHMPNFSASSPTINKGVPMTKEQAQRIACFLLENTATNPAPQPQCQGITP